LEAILTGKVFVSCGQRPPTETKAVEKVCQLLRDEFHLKTYVAFGVQSLGDIMAITNELRSCDYYLFIDFKRRPAKPQDLRCSMFTHQELALAHHLGFQDQVIALQQEGAPLEGFLRYVQSNPAKFTTIPELIKKVRILVSAKGWKPNYSRNLVVGQLTESGLVSYADHTGQSFQHTWQATIENRRPDVAAVGALCILDLINGLPCKDRACLKWAGQQAGYERTILPQDFGLVDLFAVRVDQQGLFLHSARDVAPREPT
jgi:hypothetical protein